MKKTPTKAPKKRKSYKRGRYTIVDKRAAALDINELTYPRRSGRYSGTSIGKDRGGFFLATHRARSKSYPSLAKIPNKVIIFIRSTG